MKITFAALALASFGDSLPLQKICLWFIALMAVLSYVTSGLTKLRIAGWRSGKHLSAVFSTSDYGHGTVRRTLSSNPRFTRRAAGILIGAECSYPVVFVLPYPFYYPWIVAGLAFHAGAAVFMGLNTFFWAWQSVVELPWAALRAPPGLQRDASTQATRDIGEEMQQSWERAPLQPEGQAGFTPIALLRVVADDRRRLPPCAREIQADSVLEIGGAAIRPFPLNHPQGACGYRIECGKSVVVYATDFEHGNQKLDAILLAQSQNADILICDSQYTPEEYESHRGWGHSTWLHATAFAREAGVKQLLLFHHDPDHDDQAMARIQTEARGEFENTAAAWEGLTAVL